MNRPVFPVPIVILAGSNSGDRYGFLEKARNLIRQQAGPLTDISSVYETAAWGKEDQPAFLNQAFVIHTGLSPGHLLKTLLDIEQSMGRERHERWAPRTIDLDILFYGEQVVQEPGLTIPHPEIANRMFALVPLKELLPGFRHPVSGLSISQLAAACQDKLAVVKVIKTEGQWPSL